MAICGYNAQYGSEKVGRQGGRAAREWMRDQPAFEIRTCLH